MSMMFALDEKLAASYSTVTVLEGSTLRMNKCEVKSQRITGVTGVTTIFADVWINESRIYDNFSSGIYLLCHDRNTVQITECSIYRNKIAGIMLEGYCPKVLIRKYISLQESIHRNHIEWNEEGAAVFCDLDTEPKIEGNLIRNNVVGIYGKSATPIIVNNKITRNLQDGIRMQTVDEASCLCDPTIKFNKVKKNGENGIYCMGSETRLKVFCNEISHNSRTGIRLASYSYSYIEQNMIKENGMQGILIEDTAAAYVIYNTIEKNVRANIAYGGRSSQDTVIIRNCIKESYEEGIYISKGGYSLITNNIIIENVDGVITKDSSPNIMNNEIKNNKKCGIYLLGESFPHVLGNFIENNVLCGIFMSDQSYGIIAENTIHSSYMQFAIQGLEEPKLKVLLKDNEIIGDYECINKRAMCSLL